MHRGYPYVCIYIYRVIFLLSFQISFLQSLFLLKIEDICIKNEFFFTDQRYAKARALNRVKHSTHYSTARTVLYSFQE